jgi:hypothetical protein
MELFNQYVKELKEINLKLQLLETKLDLLRDYMIQNDVRKIKIKV